MRARAGASWTISPRGNARLGLRSALAPERRRAGQERLGPERCRYPYYHTAEDTPDKLNFDHMARAVSGVLGVIEDFARVKLQTPAPLADDQ